MSTKANEFEDLKIGDIETREEKEALIAGVDEQFDSPAEVRAKIWEMIATSENAHRLDGEEMYDDMLDISLGKIFEAAHEHLGADISDLKAGASRESEDQLEAVGTGIDDRHGLESNKEPSETAKEIMNRDTTSDLQDYMPGEK